MLIKVVKNIAIEPDWTNLFEIRILLIFIVFFVEYEN